MPGEPPWPLSAAWGDYDNDGHLDLFVCHYVRWSPEAGQDLPRRWTASLAYCRPQVYEPSHCRLFHNNGDGTFTDVTHKAGMDKLQGKSMGAVWLDYDEDGWPDLFVTNDTMPNFLLHNNRDGTFTDKGTVAGVAYGDQGEAQSGMGIGVGDYDNDGREDLFAVNFSGEPKSAYKNVGQGVFESASYQSNLASTNLQFLGFGLECFDYDNDGWKDLIFGNGHVLDRMDAGDGRLVLRPEPAAVPQPGRRHVHRGPALAGRPGPAPRDARPGRGRLRQRRRRGRGHGLADRPAAALPQRRRQRRTAGSRCAWKASAPTGTRSGRR